MEVIVLRKILKLFLLFFSIMISSCNHRLYPSIVLNCDPPCWGKVIPGESAKSFVLETLRENPEIDRGTIENSLIPQFSFPDVVSWSFSEGGEGIAYFDDDILMQIEFRKLKYSLDYLITELGDPDYVFITPYWGREINIWLLYKDQGILLSYTKKLNSNNFVKIGSQDRISTITYFDPKIEDRILKDITRSAREYYGKSLEVLKQPWTGYGEVEIR